MSRLVLQILVAFVLALRWGAADDESGGLSQSVAEQWYAANADWTGSPQTCRVTRRFEMYNPHSREHLVALKAMGFTQVILDWANLHPEATALGLDVVLANWWVDATEATDIDYGFELAEQVDRQRLAGVSVMDEPERNAPDTPLEFYEELYSRLRPRLDRISPDTRLEISHWGPNWNWSDELYEAFVPLYRSADVMRIMPYPDLSEGPLSDVYFMMARSRRLMSLAGRDLPLLVILQTWTLTPDSDLPTIDELRVMAYQAMLGGAETVSFFDYNQEIWEKTPGFHDEFAGLMHELTRLSDRLASSTLQTTMTEQGILETVATAPDGFVRTIRVNTNRREVDGLPPLAVVESAWRPASGEGCLAGPACVPCQPTCAVESTVGWCESSRRVSRRCRSRRLRCFRR